MRFIDYDFTFTAPERDSLREALLEIGGHPYRDFDTFLKSLGELRDDPRLPARFEDFCASSMLRDFSREPFVVVGNAPIDPHLPRFDASNPVADKYRLKSTFVSEGFLGLYAILTGTEIIGHLSVNDGDFFHDIYPKESMYDTQSQKTLKTLRFHRDFANHFCCPDFVNTLTLRDTPENEVYSTFTVTAEAVRDLTAHELEVLSQPRFHTPYDDVSLVDTKVRLGRANDHAILVDGNDGKVFEGRTVGHDDEAQAVLDRFLAALHHHKSYRISRPGDSVMFSNHHVIHGREVNRVRDIDSLKQRWLMKTHNVYSRDNFAEFYLDGRYGVVNG